MVDMDKIKKIVDKIYPLVFDREPKDFGEIFEFMIDELIKLDKEEDEEYYK